MSLYKQLQEQLIKEYEPMTGSEYRTQMSKVKSKDKGVRKAVSHTLDKKKSKHTDHYKDHPDVKRANKYMSTEEKKNCGCGKDPCITYGKQEESVERDADFKMTKRVMPDGRVKMVKQGRKETEVSKKSSKEDEKDIQELSTDLINKVAKQRRINTGRALAKHDDRRDPEYKKAVKKQQRNVDLNFRAGARKIDKFRKSLSKEGADLRPVGKSSDYAKYAAQDKAKRLKKQAKEELSPDVKATMDSIKKQQKARKDAINKYTSKGQLPPAGTIAKSLTNESEMYDLMKKSADLRRQKRRQQQAAGAANLQKKVDKVGDALKKGSSYLRTKLGMKEEAELVEYKKRKIKDSGEEREHIIMQLRNAIDLKGRSKIQFATGRPQQIPLEHIRAALHVHDNVIKKSADKLRYMKAIEKSPQHLKRMTQGVLKGTPAMKTAKLRQSPKKPQRLSKSGIYFNPNWDSDGR